MAENSKIEWCHHTFNPWIGCTKVSEGCAHCYAENSTRARVLRHHGHETWGKGATRSRTAAANWKEPLKWNKHITLQCPGCHTDDIRDIISQCELFDVPCFVKQLGTNPVAAGHDQKHLIAMRDKKGGDWTEWPEALRVRQFPQIGGTNA